MIKNFIRIAIRNLFNQKVYSLINIVGLAIGMAACVVILLYIQQELSYENMHPDADRIYRVLTIDKALGTNNQRVGITMPALGPVLPEALPEVSAATRLTSGQKTLLTTQDQNSVFANSIRAADSNFFQFFNYKLLLGDPETALAEPYSLILTESLARQ